MADLLAQGGVTVTDETIRQWCPTFGRTMVLIVVLSPALDLRRRILESVEPVHVQALVPEAATEGVDGRVVRRVIVVRFADDFVVGFLWQAKLQAVKAVLRGRLHDPVPAVGAYLRSVVAGHIRYTGCP